MNHSEGVKNPVVYGPVSSWRLGRSLGIDLLSTPTKTCSFDCIYCQLGKTVCPLVERREFVTVTGLVRELETMKNVEADYATFSGVGEPTLANNLGKAIQVAKVVLGLPVAVLTNSSLMFKEEVRHELTQADVVVAKLDAPNQRLFRLINRPVAGLRWDEIVEGIRCFRSEYQGKLALQMMFVEANRDWATEMAEVAKELLPDEVQINTPLWPCNVQPLTKKELDNIEKSFTGLNTISVYHSPKPMADPLDKIELFKRRRMEL